MRLKVKDVMTAEPITVGPDAPFKEVANLLIERNIGGVPVVDERFALLGMITETDLITKPGYEDSSRRPMNVVRSLLHGDTQVLKKKPTSERLTAKDIMTSPVKTAAPWDDLEEVSRRLLKHHIGRMPVVDDGRLVGIVSRRDLMRQFHRTDEEIRADVERALHDPLMAESDPRITAIVDDGIVVLTGTVAYPHDVAGIESLVVGVPGVVAVRNGVTAKTDEPKAGPAAGYPDEYTPRY